MKRLIAKRAILLGCKMHEIGDTLPAADERMVNAWLAAGSAEFVNPESTPADAESASASEASASPSPSPSPSPELEALSKDELKKLADDKGIKLPRGAAKALIIDRLRSEGGAR